MPSPFPGMDPYLESCLDWTSVHHEVSAEIARQLAPKLSPRYVVRSSEWFVDEALEEDFIVEPKRRTNEQSSVGPTVSLQLVRIVPSRVPHITLEIRAVSNKQLVTVIELITSINKRGRCYQEYLDRRGDFFRGLIHLLEIDLLRAGKRVPMERPLPNVPYFVFLSRANRRPIMEVWPILLQDSLPTVPVPLLEGDADVTLDLQAAWTSAYDAFGYDLSVDYTHPPEVPLEGEDEQWAAEVLRASRGHTT